MANEQQDQNPHGEDRESDQQTMPGKSQDQTISGQGNQNSGGQGKQKQNQDPRDQAKPGSSPGAKDEEQDDDNPDHRDDSGSPGSNRQTNAGKSGDGSSEGRK
jgi:hypothetical protein